MTTSSKHTVDFQAGDDFVTLSFRTVGGVDDGGNSEHPSALTIYASQMTRVITSQDKHTVTVEFTGQLEFDAFRAAIRDLSKTLDRAFGGQS